MSANCPMQKIYEASSSESISDYESEEGFYLWYDIIQKLQKRKIDDTAFAASGKQCRFCTREDQYSEFKKKLNPEYSENELRDDEDLTSLNNWQSKSIPRRERSSSAADETARGNSSALTYRPFSRSKLVLEQPRICEGCSCKNDECCCSSFDSSDGPICTILQIEEILTIAHPQGQTRSKLPYEILKKAVQKMTFNNIENLFQLSQYDMKTLLSKKLHSSKTTIERSNDKTELLTMPKCAICDKIFCQCKEHLEKEAEQFVDQLKYELKNIRKDKSCITDKEEEKVSEIKQLCIICGHDNCNCRETSPKTPKYFHFIHLAHENEPSNVSDEQSESKIQVLTEAERISKSPLQRMMSGHIREDVCHADQRIDSDITLSDVSGKSESTVQMTSQLPKKSTVSCTLQSKATKNKDLMTVESNTKYGIPLVQHAGQYVRSKSLTSVEMAPEGNSSEKHKEKSNANSETVKRCQAPMLWYCSDMPQKKGNTSLPSTTLGRKL